MRRFLLILLCIGVWLPIGISQNTALQSKIERVFSSREFKHSAISVTVMDVAGDSLLASVNPYMGATPASSLKVLTTLISLQEVGPDFKWTTEIAYMGDVLDDGTLEGDLYIIGSGDPTLGSGKFSGYPSYEQVLKEISQIVRDAGITCIDGKVISDESAYNSYPIAPTWQWNDLGNYYASGAWGLNINENRYTIYFSNRGVIGRRPRIASYYPTIPGITFSNEVSVDSSHTGDQAYIFGGPYDYTKRIVGTIPQGKGSFSIKGAIPDPPRFFAYQVMESLDKIGIQASGYDVNFSPNSTIKRSKRIGVLESPTLAEVARRANHESNNLYCESMLKSLGKKVRGDGTGQLGISAIRRHLKKLKVDYKCLIMEDGSGLSNRNTVCSYLLADFLNNYISHYGIESVTDYLPCAGRQGTVKSFLKNYSCSGKVWVKSGTMSTVTSFTGVVKTAKGELRTFSIIVDGYTVKGRTIRYKLQKVINDIYKS